MVGMIYSTRNELHSCTPPQQSPKEKQPILKTVSAPAPIVLITSSLIGRVLEHFFFIRRNACKEKKSCKQWQKWLGAERCIQYEPMLLNPRSLSMVLKIILVATVMRQILNSFFFFFFLRKMTKPPYIAIVVNIFHPQTAEECILQPKV